MTGSGTGTGPLAVLYEDAHLIAVDKPAGLLTQGRAGGEPTLEDAVRAYLATPGGPAPPDSYLGTVHRLDRPVSGVVVWARTVKAARRLAAQFAARETIKEYWAVVETTGAVPDPGSAGVWDDWLTATTDGRGVVSVSVRVAAGDEAPGLRRAVTRYEVARAAPRPADGTALLRLWPETGRTHQLRAQAAARGMPVLGDAAYGATRPFPAGIALHARSLAFRHPALKNTLVVTAPVPEAWAGQGVEEWGEGEG